MGEQGSRQTKAGSGKPGRRWQGHGGRKPESLRQEVKRLRTQVVELAPYRAETVRLRALVVRLAEYADFCPACGSHWLSAEFDPHGDDCEYVACGGTVGVGP